ncbi:hypothetical protein Skr01_75350 [Sphaerisporangium krabiense]|uniref:Putative spore protein YtfJ n=1 Tax=Sphaerisporangium krabiense TaxID=763782 RepID=A0A7W9DTJ5_9ACTN|nr:spore germination protein GerW family protein [Sphaerisporangium krabiense]MBB5630683.1 putative spore protein YtfJ [Sphaerisporangium krabiense]GII67450.1 hypothetical protein Skr01_75350 [Sphaerisporangium krabiense]
MELREFFEHLSGTRRVYGEPYEKDGVTVIPAVSVSAGGGFGRGERRGLEQGKEDGGSGGGGGAIARPAGAYVIKDGEVRWEPALDVNRLVLGGQLLLGLALILIARHLRRR